MILTSVFSSTAAATFRQAVALIFDHVVGAESLPAGKFGSGSQISRTSSVTGDVNRSINFSEYVDSHKMSMFLAFLLFFSLFVFLCLYLIF